MVSKEYFAFVSLDNVKKKHKDMTYIATYGEMTIFLQRMKKSFFILAYKFQPFDLKVSFGVFGCQMLYLFRK